MSNKNNRPFHQSFYCSSRPNEQNGMYNLFVKKKKIPIEIVVQLLEEIRLKNNLRDNRSDKSLVIDVCKKNFDQFLKRVTEVTGAKFGPKRQASKKRRTGGYDEWWQENNLNGGFAYNGVTDDF